MTRSVFVRCGYRSHSEDQALRALIYGLVGLAVAAALILIGDVDKALPLVNLIVWPTVALARFVLLMRSSTRGRRRGSRRSPPAYRRGSQLTDQRRNNLRLPPR